MSGHATHAPLKKHAFSVSEKPLPLTPSLEPLVKHGSDLDLSSAPAASRARSAVRNLFLVLWTTFQTHPWTIEILAVACSFAMILFMAILLRAYDGRPASDWLMPMNLNSFISLCVTILYMLLMSPISASLSQYKWNHFSSPRALYDFHIVDQASRTPFGSLKLVLRRPKMYYALHAALLTLAVQAIGPLVQQVIDINVENVQGPGLAFMPVANLSFQWPADTHNVITYSDSPLWTMRTVIQAYAGLSLWPIATQKPSRRQQLDEQLLAYRLDEVHPEVHSHARRDLPIGPPQFSRVQSSPPGFPQQPQEVRLQFAPKPAIGAIYKGLYSNVKDDFSITAVCSGVGCTWPTYESQIVYGQYQNVSASLRVNTDVNATWSMLMQRASSTNVSMAPMDGLLTKLFNMTTLVSLPNGYNITLLDVLGQAEIPAGTTLSNLTYSREQNKRHYYFLSPSEAPLNVTENSGTILVLQSIYLEATFDKSGWYLGQVVASEYALHFGSQKYTADSMRTLNVLEEDSSGPLVPCAPLPSSSLSIRQAALRYDGFVLNNDTSRSTFLSNANPAPNRALPPTTPSISEPRFPSLGSASAIDPYGAASLSYTLAQVFRGASSGAYWQGSPLLQKYGLPSDAAAILLTSTLNELEPDAGLRVTTLNATDVMANTARALTQWMRIGANTAVPGTTFVAAAVYRASWAWFAIPVVLALLAAAVVTATALDTARRGVDVWTDSSLAVMIHGIADAERDRFLRLEDDVKTAHESASATSGSTGASTRARRTVTVDAKATRVRLRPGRRRVLEPYDETGLVAEEGGTNHMTLERHM